MKIESKRTIIAGAQMLIFIAAYYGVFLILKTLVERKVLSGQAAAAYLLAGTAALLFLSVSFICFVLLNRSNKQTKTT